MLDDPGVYMFPSPKSVRQRHSIGKAIMAGTKPVVLCDDETLESYGSSGAQGGWNQKNQ